jgi:Holliday junction resolvase RusA-like endonuclease
MERQEFRRQLDELQREIACVIFCYQVWLASWPTREVVDMLNRYKHFFCPVRDALYRRVYIGFANIFDRNKRTMSLMNLLQAAKQAPCNLVPYMSKADVEKLEERLSQHGRAVRAIRRVRLQHIAHLDAKPSTMPRVLKKDVDALIETVKDVFNQLHRAHDRQVYSWTYVANRSEWEAKEILRILCEEAKARRAEAEAILKSPERHEP